MATIKDVASLAGVSTATVSRVINQTAWVEPVTRERVEKAMRDLNYRRNAAAIALAKRSGDMLGLLTGKVGSHTDGTPEPDFQKQVRLAFENLKATLTAAGCTFDDIVDVTTFHTDPEQQFGDVMAVKQEIFSLPPYPNWTAVGVNWLAGFDFEIKVIARIP
ncbi:LacI family DNA-binding transcriptional regulator [Salmonella enterica]|nr:LacI family DNA-binding transcriptional regulator [Salmonella enterica]ECD9303810.1 LacI family DNA-binding transcriptional regulator [Salmonella enterica subsp. salamae]ECD9459116.1 LacI family DNA-binding transcriptional regulator [Salmonella enterica subsp. salamae]ECE5349099.1 LacI family DNA-binding transcriptional regulator [Salmonella enterica]ECI3975517.1 RidA family protein [Salmonella enterica subsp. salamae]